MISVFIFICSFYINCTMNDSIDYYKINRKTGSTYISDLEMLKTLKGDIRLIKQRSFSFYDLNGNVTKTPRLQNSTMTYDVIFNNNGEISEMNIGLGAEYKFKSYKLGQLFSEIRYDKDGVEILHREFFYSEDDFLSHIISYNKSKIDTFKIDVVIKDGLEYRIYNELTDIYKDRKKIKTIYCLDSFTEFSYFLNGNLREELSYSKSSGQVQSIIRYDDKCNLKINALFSYQSNVLYGIFVSFFDEVDANFLNDLSNLHKTTNINYSLTTVSPEKIITQSHNRFLNRMEIVSEQIFNDRDLVCKIRNKIDDINWVEEFYQYEYDQLGNWTKRSTFKNNQIVEIVEREIIYF